MSVDLERQLLEYGRRLDASISPLDVDEVVVKSATSHRERPAWAVAVVAALLVLVVIGGVSLLVGGGSDEAPLVDDPNPPPVTTPTTSETNPESESDSSAKLLPGVDGSVYFKATWSNSDGFERTHAIWYLDDDTWRWEIVDAATVEGGEDELIGMVTVREGEEIFEYMPLGNTYTIFDLDIPCTDSEDDPWPCAGPELADFNPSIDGEVFFLTEYTCDEVGTCVQVSDGDRWDDCAVTDGGVIAGVPTVRYQCSREVTVKGSLETELLDFHQHSSGRTISLESTLFHDTGFREVIVYEVVEVDFDPTFESTLFKFECPTDDCRDSNLPPDPFTSNALIGESAPATSGQLLGGGSLDLASLRGQRVVLTFWASWCPPCTDYLGVLEGVATEREGIDWVTALVIDERASGEAFVRDTGLSLLVLDLTSVDNILSETWAILGIPAYVFIDEDGVVRAVKEGSAERDEIIAILDSLGW